MKLGNALATVSDRKTPVIASSLVTGYKADVVSAQYYYPFGSTMPEHTFLAQQNLILNDNFSSLTGWNANLGSGYTMTLSSGRLKFTSSFEYSGPYKAFATIPGKRYRIKFTLDRDNTPAVAFVARDDQWNNIKVDIAYNSGTFELIFIATTYESRFHLEGTDYGVGGSKTFYLDDVVIEEVLEGYRYDFNGKEQDNETGSQDYGLRIYNPDLGRFLSTDPLTSDFPWWSPYHFAGNNPIRFIDVDGMEPFDPMGMQLHYYYIGENAARKGESRLEAIKRNSRQMATAQIGGTLLGAATAAGIYYSPLLAWWAMNPANQTMLVGLTGLTASFIDPNPNSDYPGGLDDVKKGVQLLIKNAGVAKFIINTSKFDYFFGKVKAVANASQKQLDNAFKSAERVKIFETLGIKDNKAGREALVSLFNNALENGKEIARESNEFGLTISKQIEVVNGKIKGTVNVGFFYKDGDLSSTPIISTAVPKIN